MITPASREEVRSVATKFLTRQRLRVALMGVGDGTGIVSCLQRDLLALEQHIEDGQRFLFGSRPSLADFAVFGQLSQLVLDYDSSKWLRENTPRLYAWTFALDEPSGIEGQWLETSEAYSPVVLSLLKNIGRFYMPYLDANARALAQGADSFEVKLPGGAVAHQPPIEHQAASLHDLRAMYAMLNPKSRAKVQDVLEQANVVKYLVDTSASVGPTAATSSSPSS